MQQTFTPPKKRLELEELLESLRILIKNNIVKYSEIESYIYNKQIYLDQAETPLSQIWLSNLKKNVHSTKFDDLKFYLVYDYRRLDDKTLGQIIAFYLFYLTVKKVYPEFIAFLRDIDEPRLLTLLQEKLLNIT
jgi:hypothetical protein